MAEQIPGQHRVTLGADKGYLLYRPPDSAVDTVRDMAIPVQGERWHRDLLVFAVLCTLWSVMLIFRVLTRDPFSSQAYPFQDVFLGVKFYGRVAHITMAIQAIIYGALGIGILLHQRWGLILGYFTSHRSLSVT